MNTHDTFTEPARAVPVAWRGDLCVVGGSCTGVFAAVRAARLGLSVALVEQNALLGGSATAAEVNEWHSIRDARQDQQIIGGLTIEVIDRLRARDAVREISPVHRSQFKFNSAELAAELDTPLWISRRSHRAWRGLTWVRWRSPPSWNAPARFFIRLPSWTSRCRSWTDIEQ